MFNEGADSLANSLFFPIKANNKTANNLYAILLKIFNRFHKRVPETLKFIDGFEHILIRGLDPDKNSIKVGRSHEIHHLKILPQIHWCLGYKVKGFSPKL